MSSPRHATAKDLEIPELTERQIKMQYLWYLGKEAAMAKRAQVQRNKEHKRWCRENLSNSHKYDLDRHDHKQKIQRSRGDARRLKAKLTGEARRTGGQDAVHTKRTYNDTKRR